MVACHVFLLMSFLMQRAHAALRAHALFSNYVVLQTSDDNGPGTAISGSGSPFETITLKMTAKVLGTVKVDASGSWVMPLKLGSGGPFNLTLQGSMSTEEITANDVLIGDVYLCSGQVASS